MDEKVILILNGEDCYKKHLPKNVKILCKDHNLAIKSFQEEERNNKNKYCGCSPEINGIYLRHPFFDIYFCYEGDVNDIKRRMAEYTADRLVSFYRYLGAKSIKCGVTCIFGKKKSIFTNIKGRYGAWKAENETRKDTTTSLESYIETRIKSKSPQRNEEEARKILDTFVRYEKKETLEQDLHCSNNGEEISRKCKLIKGIKESLESVLKISSLEGIDASANVKTQTELYEQIVLELKFSL